MGLKLITAPAHTPITLAEAKAHMRVDGTTDDALITALIGSAVEAAQNITRRQLVTATYDYTLPGFPAPTRMNPLAAIELLAPPLQAVQGIYYVDKSGVEQPLPCGSYVVDSCSLVPGIYPAVGASWPSPQEGPNAVRVRYTCGWPMTDSVSPTAWTGPESIKSWLLIRVATLYEQREALAVGSGVAVADVSRSFVDGLLDPYIVPVVV